MLDVSTTTEPKKSNRVFHRYGDRELWLVRGQNDLWQLPVIVEWFLEDGDNGIHCGLVYPACVVYLSQALALTDILSVHDLLGKSDRWFIPRLTIEAILTKAPGLTPLYYYRWPEEACPGVLADRSILVPLETERPRPGVPQEAESFLGHLSREHAIPMSMLRVVWTAISMEGPKWLLNHRRVIDFGFTKIFAAPFRGNWKQVVAWKCRRWGLATIFSLPKADSEADLARRGFDEVLCSLHNFGLTQSRADRDHRFIDYTIEAIPSTAFKDAAYECERSRWDGGWCGYLRTIEETIEAHYDNLVASLKTYVQKVRLPFARLRESRNGSGVHLVPATALTKADEVHGASIRRLPVSIVEAGWRCSLLATRGTSDAVHPAFTEMPEMSDLPQAQDDLRECEGSTAVDGQGDNAHNGLSLLDAGEGDAPRRPVLPQSEDDTWHAPRLV